MHVGDTPFPSTISLIVSGSTFVGNHAQHSGGALYFQQKVGETDPCRDQGKILLETQTMVHLQSCNFSSNVARNGGALYVGSATRIFIDSQTPFLSNRNHLDSINSLMVDSGGNVSLTCPAGTYWEVFLRGIIDNDFVGCPRLCGTGRYAAGTVVDRSRCERCPKEIFALAVASRFQSCAPLVGMETYCS